MGFSSNQPLVANQLPISVQFPRDPQDFIDTIDLLYKRVANAVNTKEGALYLLQELATFQQFFTSGDPLKLRNGYRKVIQIDPAALPTFNHNIQGITQITDYWGIANTNIPDFRKLPYAAVGANANIEMVVSSTSVTIVKGAGAPYNIIGGIVVLEYLKD